MHRTWGGILAGGLFIVPGIIAIMALSHVYAAYGNVGLVAAAFFGLKAAVLAIVLHAVVRIGRRALKNRVAITIAAASWKHSTTSTHPRYIPSSTEADAPESWW